MRRTHLRGHENILKRLLVHGGGFNLGLLMRQLFGIGTPRGLQGRLRALLAYLIRLCRRAIAASRGYRHSAGRSAPSYTPWAPLTFITPARGFTTDC